MTNLRANVVANYTSFAYSTAISLAFMPLLYGLLGPEAFGLIGAYVLLVNLIALLDLGLVSTVSRECAAHRNNPRYAGSLRQTIRGAELFLHSIAGLIIFAYLVLPERAIDPWFGGASTSFEPAEKIYFLILLTAILRWASGLYRGIVNGFEMQIETSTINAISATLRFPAAYALILHSNNQTITYFIIQLAVSFLEYATLRWMAKSSLVNINHSGLSLSEGKALACRIIKLAASVSILTLITTAYSQVDKLILMYILSLDQFGKFSLIQTATTGIAALGGPIATALIPRLTSLVSAGAPDGLFGEYIKSQHIMLSLMLPCGITCALFAPKILFAWTGDAQFSTSMAAIFGAYALGSCIWVVSTIPCHLRFASGEMNFLIKYNSGMVFVYVPMALIMAMKFGPIGAGLAWLAANLLALIVGYVTIIRNIFPPPIRAIIHREFVLVTAVAVIILFFFHAILPTASGRFVAALQSIGCMAITSAISFLVLSTLYGKNKWSSLTK